MPCLLAGKSAKGRLVHCSDRKLKYININTSKLLIYNNFSIRAPAVQVINCGPDWLIDMKIIIAHVCEQGLGTLHTFT